jgi:hypothetical protein
MRLRGLLLGLVGVVVLGLPAGAGAVEGGCANEVLRSELGSGFLPDCRAYEMVTPPYKEGYEFGVEGFSSDGSRAFLTGLGTLAGVEGAGESATGGATVYVDTRTASGWQLEPVNPPLSEFVGQLPVAFEADKGLSLWMQHTLAQSALTRDLYVRSADGVYSLVGPLVTPEHSVGEPSNVMETEHGAAEVKAVTSDYEHIVLYAANNEVYWPFDHTVGSGGSLYEYSGTGNSEPVLVGVSGPKRSTQLLGECGTRLGGANIGSAYNALSGDGETIFFTLLPQGTTGCEASAPVFAEVWARRHGSLLSSVPAESVDVSVRAPEPACTGACRSSVESGKSFEGASEDGERVFFTSTQQLLNGASQDPEASDSAYNDAGVPGCAVTTGVGGCNLYEYDFNAAAGDRLRLVAGGAEVLGVARITQDGSRVYFVAKGVLTARGNEFGASAVAGQPNLYVYDSEEAERDPGYEPVFIATLSPGDQGDWQREDARPVQATPDGRFLVFSSSQPGLTPGDTGPGSQVFEYDAQTGALVRVSQGEDGYDDNGNPAASFLRAPQVFRGDDFHSSTNQSYVADDGLTVVFESTGRLSPLASSAEAGCPSVYEYRSGGSIANGAVHLLSDGLDTQLIHGGCEGARFIGMDAGGDNILFSTADALLGSDTDTRRDTYDARVGGGFALPSVPAGCQGDGCLGALTAPPVLAGAGSVAVSNAGNLTPASASPVVKSRAKPLTRAQKLSKALRSCRREPGRRRRLCEARARKRYGSSVTASKANGRIKR